MLEKSRVLPLLAVMCLAGLIHAAGEDLSQWAHSKVIVINTSPSGYDIGGDLYGFPYLIRLSKASFDFSQASAVGDDIRFSRGDSALSYEIDRWDSAQTTAAIWVRIDTIRGNDATQSITMYWGKPDAISSSNGAEVFSKENGFAGVWHLSERADSSSIEFRDATVNANHGAGVGLIAQSRAAAVVGYGQMLHGAECVAIPALNLNSNTVTMSAWVKVFGPQVFWSSPLFSRAGPDMASGLSIAGFFFHYHWAGKYYDWEPTLKVPSYRYAYMALAVTPDSATLYLGARDSLIPRVNVAKHDTDAFAASLFVGQDPFKNSRYLNGTVDEAVISQVTRSADWVKLCYLNQRYIPDAAPTIQYPQDTFKLYSSADSAAQPALSGFIDSIAIVPTLPQSLTFDPLTGVITGAVSDTMGPTAFIVLASNQAGTGEDTIVIQGRAGMKARNLHRDKFTVPQILALRSGSRPMIQFFVPSMLLRSMHLVLYDLKGSRVWSRALEGTAVRAGVQSIPMGDRSQLSSPAGRAYIVEMRMYDSGGRCSIVRRMVTAIAR